MHSPESTKVKFAPSFVCADYLHLKRDIRSLERAKVDMLHFDIMDGHYVPNLTIGPDFVMAMRQCTTLPFDIHLMTTDPDFWIPLFAEVGNATLSVQVEAPIHLNRTISFIKEHGARASVALNPATPLCSLDHILQDIEQVLIMTVNPGYSGQKLIPAMYDKIRCLRKMIDASGLDVEIQVDGGLSPKTAPKLAAAGATVMVGGKSSFFLKGVPIGKAVQRIRKTIK